MIDHTNRSETHRETVSHRLPVLMSVAAGLTSSFSLCNIFMQNST